MSSHRQLIKVCNTRRISLPSVTLSNTRRISLPNEKVSNTRRISLQNSPRDEFRVSTMLVKSSFSGVVFCTSRAEL